MLAERWLVYDCYDCYRRARLDLLDIGAFTADRWGDDQAERT